MRKAVYACTSQNETIGLGHPGKTVLQSETFDKLRYTQCLCGNESFHLQYSRFGEAIEAPDVIGDPLVRQEKGR